MSDSPDFPSPDSTMDSELARILEQYLQDQENDNAQPRDQWLADHPKYAERLAACLDGVELIGVGGFLQGDVSGKHTETTVAPKVIGDYEIMRELGRGGMGVVYEARERSLDRIVALKVMRFGVVDPKALERFQREAETAGDLHHTNIVPVYATGREGDTSWYAMQRIDGDSLAKRIQVAARAETPISLEEIVQFGVQAAEALHHAHERDVIHRDVKPANLIVDGEDRVWLTDFGLARRLVDAGATMTGAMMGTPRYMSPEQASLKGDDVDRRTDIYSLGATLFELATGKPPFDGEDPLTIISQIRYEDPTSVCKNRTELPVDLDVVLAKCLEKDPNRRYATAAELADDLRAIGDDRPISARRISILERAARATRKHRARFRVAGLAILATAATILFSFAAWQSWKSDQLGAFRFRAGGGPFVSTVKPIGGSSFSAEAQTLTVPMQVPLKLKAGEYDMMLAPRGQWSKNVRLPVPKGSENEYRMGATKATKQIDIAGYNAIAVAGFKEPAVLLRKDGQLQRVTQSGDNDWSVDVSEVETQLTILTNLEDEPTNFLVNFAATDLLIDTPLNRARFETNPQHAAPVHALTTSIDIDGDSRSDHIIAAPNKSALLAIDSNGKTLWARSYGLNADEPMGNPNNLQKRGTRQPDFIYPGVMELIDVGDQNDDGVNDIVSMMIQIRPGIRTDSAVILISGQTGKVLSTFQAPALKIAHLAMWSRDGFLRVSGNEWRDSGTLGFGYRGPVRNRIHNSPQVSNLGKSSNPEFAVPSPLRVAKVGDKILAVHHADDTFRIIDVSAGKQVGGDIKLPFGLASAPRIACLGDSEHAIIFHESGLLAPVIRSGDRRLLIAYRMSDGKLLWRKSLRYVDWSNACGDRSQTDWPLAVDANGDGKDELFVPTARYMYGVDVGVQMLDSSKGEPQWDSSEYQITGSADDFIHRMAISADIDGDGWRDLVTATISGEPVEQTASSTPRRRKPIGKAYVYVDWISGKTGLALSWARSPIPILSDRIDVAEIDAIRCNVPGGKAGAVEVDLITGDSRDDLELDSLVLRFHPSSPDPIATAAGVEAIELPIIDGSQRRIFYARPGPYAEGNERLVFLNDEQSDVVRLGEHDLLATWSEAGQTFLALKNEESRNLVVVDANSMRTIWRLDANPTSNSIPVAYSDRTKDILIEEPDEEGDTIPILIDGKSGEKKWAMSQTIFGKLKVARALDNDSRILVVGDGRVKQSRLPRPPDYFKMTMVDAKNGKAIWSKYFLRHAPRFNHPTPFDDLQFVDVNDDGHLDIVGPDQGEDEQLELAVWDGASGDRLWFRSLFFKASRTDYYISFCLIDRKGKPAIAYYGPETAKATGKRSIIVCDARSGDVLMSKLEKSPSDFPDRDYEHDALAIADCSLSSNEPRLGVMVTGPRGKNEWNLYDVSEQMTSVDSWTRDQNRGNDQSRWLHDIDGDSLPERFIASKPPTKGSHRDYTFSCFPFESNEPKWQSTFSLGYARKIHWQSNRSLAFLEFDRWHVLLDLMSGRELIRVPIAAADRFDMPMVTEVHRNEDEVAVRLAIPAREGIVNRWVGDTKQVPFPKTKHQQTDPRRIRPLLGAINMGSTSPWEILVGAAKGIVVLSALVLIPFYYVARIIRRRRFSLSWMMLAAPVSAIFMLTWSAEWVQNPGRLPYVFSGLGFILIPAVMYSLFSTAKTGRDDRSKFFAGVAAIFLMLILYNYSQADDPTYVYSFAWSDLFKIAWASVSLAIWIYCIGAVILGFRRMRLRWRKPKQSRKLAA